MLEWIPVRHRSYATYSRQPRQVRKEATVTGSCVCSEPPVPDYFHFFGLIRLDILRSILQNTEFPNLDDCQAILRSPH